MSTWPTVAISAPAERVAMTVRLYRAELALTRQRASTTRQLWLSWRGFEFFGSRGAIRPCLPAIDLPIVTLQFDGSIEDWIKAAQAVIIANHHHARARFEPIILLSIHDTIAYAAAHDAYWATKPRYWSEWHDWLAVQRGQAEDLSNGT